MKTSRIIQIDYYLGSFLCFLLSFINLIFSPLTSFKRRDGAVKKILFIKFTEIGAIILSYPLLRKIREEYPSAELFLLTLDSNKEVFSLLGGIIAEKDILTIRSASIWVFTMDFISAIRRLRRKGIDVVFDLEFFSRFSAAATYLTGARKRIGFYRYTFEGLFRGNMLTHRVQFNPLAHIAKTYFSFAQVIKSESKDSPQMDVPVDSRLIYFPGYKSNAELKRRIENKIKAFGITDATRIFLVNPGEGVLPLREWPIEQFAILSRGILEKQENRLFIIGLDEIQAKGRNLLKLVNHPRCIDLTGKTSLGELMELFMIAKAVILNDCGLAHLAMLTPIMKFVIFGPESPQVFGPLDNRTQIIYSDLPCSPCFSILNHRRSACTENKCLKAISPEHIFKMINKFI